MVTAELAAKAAIAVKNARAAVVADVPLDVPVADAPRADAPRADARAADAPRADVIPVAVVVAVDAIPDVAVVVVVEPLPAVDFFLSLVNRGRLTRGLF